MSRPPGYGRPPGVVTHRCVRGADCGAAILATGLGVIFSLCFAARAGVTGALADRVPVDGLLTRGVSNGDPLAFRLFAVRSSSTGQILTFVKVKPVFTVIDPSGGLCTTEDVDCSHRAKLLAIVVNPIVHNDLPGFFSAKLMPGFLPFNRRFDRPECSISGQSPGLAM